MFTAYYKHPASKNKFRNLILLFFLTVQLASINFHFQCIFLIAHCRGVKINSGFFGSKAEN